MATLNRDAAEAMAGHPVHACTDVTGFGLLGHLAEMIVGAGLAAEVDSAALPIIPHTLEYAAMGLIPAGTYKNREFRKAIVDIEASVDRGIRDALFDPQTSGGLLIGVHADYADALLGGLHRKGATDSAVIGSIAADPNERIRVI
jgi:selenide,water dikinase